MSRRQQQRPQPPRQKSKSHLQGLRSGFGKSKSYLQGQHAARGNSPSHLQGLQTGLGKLLQALLTQRTAPRLLPLVLLLLLACQPRSPGLTVFAAASLREALTDVAALYEAQHPGQTVTLQFAGSQELRMQLQHGARADVVATADDAQMAQLVQAGVAHGPQPLTCNRPVLVLGRDAPADVVAFADLPRLRRIVLGAPAVPIGAYAEQILAHAGPEFAAAVQAHVVSREPNARQVLAKVTLGEADAAIVYATDARVAGAAVRTVAIPAAVNVTARYAIAAGDGAQAAAAGAFIALSRAAAGQAALAARGFVACP